MISPNFGTYRLTYEPPSDAQEPEVAINMSLSSDATVPQLLDLFERFLQVNGYDTEGKQLELKIREPQGWPNVVTLDNSMLQIPFGTNED